MLANLILVWNKLYHWKKSRMSDNKSRVFPISCPFFWPRRSLIDWLIFFKFWKLYHEKKRIEKKTIDNMSRVAGIIFVCRENLKKKGTCQSFNYSEIEIWIHVWWDHFVRADSKHVPKFCAFCLQNIRLQDPKFAWKK